MARPIPLAPITADILTDGNTLVIGSSSGICVLASGMAGLGELVFIFTKGTIGPAMNLGFGLYRGLMVAAGRSTS